MKLQENAKLRQRKERSKVMYVYRIIKEDFYTGERGKRTRKIFRREPLTVGGLYMQLGKGYPGAYRVLEEIERPE